MRRALLLGSQTGGLTGVHGDVELVDDALTRLGFATMPTIEGAATADGIVGRYRELVQDTASDDVAVVYYSGHGGRMRNPVADPSLPAWLQYIVPTDADDRSDGRVRYVLAEELSLLQRELTAKSRNVTVILDCCHSARMSRAAAAVPKAVDHLVAPDGEVVRRWRELRSDAQQAEANPDAVRVVACGPDQSAYEMWNAALGARHGALTAALIPALTSTDAAASTWMDVLEVVRLGIPVAQRPAVEGPTDRLLFSLKRRSGSGVLPVRVEQGRAVLENALLFGIAVGDTYAVVAAGHEVAASTATATVVQIAAGRAVLDLHGTTPDQLRPGTSAWPLDVALGRRPVAVQGAAGALRDGVVAALDGSIRVRSTEDATDAFATVRLDDAGVQVLDADDQPLYATPPVADPVATAVADVERLALAEQVRGLRSGEGAAALPVDVTVTHVRLLPDGEEVALAPGEHLFVGDRLLVRIESAAPNRFASVFDVGVAGAVTLLTTAQPDGTTLTEGLAYELGRDWLDGAVRLSWPDGLPAAQARPESLVTIITDAQVPRLHTLGQRGVSRSRGAQASALDRLVDDVAVGRRDVTPGGGSGVRHRVERFDFVLHPTSRPADGEPAFELDERPDPSFRLVVPRGSGAAPTRMAVRLSELTVHSNRSFLRARVRVDALVVSAAGSGRPFRAETLRVDRVRDGDRLPLHDVLLYEGPVARFLDVALWVSKDDSPDVDLAELLAAETGDADVAAAMTTLAALAVAQPAAALVVGSAAAVAVLVRTAARVIDRVRGTSIGVYRTSLLPHQGFGVVADGVGRRPASGVLRAQDMSFALEFVDQGR